jgi:metal-responsive CopG/Arc/MetJ family transcriptional regulator
MKRKTSITLSDELFEELDRYAGSEESRSSYIERVLRYHFRERERVAREAADLERIDAAADRLNAEMAEVLELQAPWSDDG